MPRQTEYTSVFSPFDAEAVQGKDRMNPLTSEGLYRINAFINNELSKGFYSPHNTIANLKVKLNHLNLDFPFNNNQEIGGIRRIRQLAPPPRTHGEGSRCAGLFPRRRRRCSSAE